MQSDNQYAAMFRMYLRTGIEPTTGHDSDGGYSAPENIARKIADAVTDISPFRRLATVDQISGDVLSVPHELSDTSHLIPTHELYAQPKATQKFVEDAAFQIEEWLAGRAAEIFAGKEKDAFVNGSGVGMPQGILPYVENGRIEVLKSGVGGELTDQGVISLIRRIPDRHRRNACFILSRKSMQAARLLVAPSSSAYLWQPGLSAGSPDTLAGFPVHIVDEMPTPENGSLSVAFGDFRAGYRIVDKAGVRALRDPFTEKPFVKFSTTKRVGGDVVDPDAIKVLALAA